MYSVSNNLSYKIARLTQQIGKLLFIGFIMHTPMPSLIYKGGVGEGFAVGGWTPKKVRRIRKICGKGRVSPGIGLHKSSVPTAIPSVGFADSSPC